MGLRGFGDGEGEWDPEDCAGGNGCCQGGSLGVVFASKEEKRGSAGPVGFSGA